MPLPSFEETERLIAAMPTISNHRLPRGYLVIGFVAETGQLFGSMVCDLEKATPAAILTMLEPQREQTSGLTFVAYPNAEAKDLTTSLLVTAIMMGVQRAGYGLGLVAVVGTDGFVAPPVITDPVPLSRLDEVAKERGFIHLLPPYVDPNDTDPHKIGPIETGDIHDRIGLVGALTDAAHRASVVKAEGHGRDAAFAEMGLTPENFLLTWEKAIKGERLTHPEVVTLAVGSQRAPYREMMLIQAASDAETAASFYQGVQLYDEPEVYSKVAEFKVLSGDWVAPDTDRLEQAITAIRTLVGYFPNTAWVSNLYALAGWCAWAKGEGIRCGQFLEQSMLYASPEGDADSFALGRTLYDTIGSGVIPAWVYDHSLLR